MELYVRLRALWFKFVENLITGMICVFAFILSLFVYPVIKIHAWKRKREEYEPEDC